MFLEAGLEQIETRTVDVCLAYADFTDFWESQTPDYQPTTKIIAQMKPSERTRLMQFKRPCLRVPAARSSTARANAIKAGTALDAHDDFPDVCVGFHARLACGKSLKS